MTALDPLPPGPCAKCHNPQNPVGQCGVCGDQFCRFCLADQLTPRECRECFRTAAKTFHKRMPLKLCYAPESVVIRRTRPTTPDTPYSWIVQVNHENGESSTGLKQDLDEAIYAAYRQAQEDGRHARHNTSNTK